ncbi:MAG: 4'-phosphopantetheinyl transferase superfamily protein [Cyanobacteria bacterium J06607_10]
MANAVEVWKIPLTVSEEILETYVNCLSVDERSRADRFRFPDDRRKFIVARGTLRYLLSEQFDQPPAAIEFCYGEYGKPSVNPASQAETAQSRAGSCNFHFNISHSGELALCAFGHRRRVGIDLEKLKDIQRLDGMMERCLSTHERYEVAAASNSLQAFLQRWTCKEAYLKAIGTGLVQPMTTVEVALNPPRLISVPNDRELDWQLHLIEVPSDYVSALVVEGKAEIKLSRWQHSLGHLSSRP